MINLRAPGGRMQRHAIKVLAGALGIPELMPPESGGIFKVNLHAPGRRMQRHAKKTLAGALELLDN